MKAMRKWQVIMNKIVVKNDDIYLDSSDEALVFSVSKKISF